MLLVGGRTDRNHPIRARMGGVAITAQEEIMYLGVKLSKGFGMGPHVMHIADKAETVTNRLACLGGAMWGVKFPVTRTLYLGVILGSIRYAAEVWAKKLNGRQWSKIKTAQRRALIRVTRGYRTVSHEALQVLAGVMPIDLVLKEQVTSRLVRKRGLEDLPRETQERIQVNPVRWKQVLRQESLDEWNARWTAGARGSTLRRYFPTVQSRLSATWVEPNYWISQMLTGHGGFRAKLYEFRRSERQECPHCGELDTAEHVVLSCSALEGPRFRLMRSVGIYSLEEHDLHRLVDSKRNYEAFVGFVKE